MTPSPQVYTVRALMERWGVSYKTILAMCASGELAAFRIRGRSWRVTAEEVSKYETRRAG